jgi:hypothetical protein
MKSASANKPAPALDQEKISATENRSIFLSALEVDALLVSLSCRHRCTGCANSQIGQRLNTLSQRLAKLYTTNTATCAANDTLDLTQVPWKYRLTAASFMAGLDIRNLLPERTLYRHAKILRQFGLKIARDYHHATQPNQA